MRFPWRVLPLPEYAARTGRLTNTEGETLQQVFHINELEPVDPEEEPFVRRFADMDDDAFAKNVGGNNTLTTKLFYFAAGNFPGVNV